MKPIIGITCSKTEDNEQYVLHRAHVKAIEQFGGMPIMLPYIVDESIEEISERIDGLYLTGGGDLDPVYFQEEPHRKLGEVDPERDRFELILTQQLLLKNKPIFAVCRGSQLLNVALGGKMHQHIYSELKSDLQHIQTAPIDYPSHSVTISPNSKLFEMIETTYIRVNSNHHQANSTLGKHIIASAFAPDGVIEAIESTEHSFVIGVQWHPERLLDSSDEYARKMYTAFIAACTEHL